ncbi:hypothetical protein ACFQL0_20750 [Haloplanus litoreus]|uniref:hypothetical protein n=1 Tax=Haloplanus litoreus TaxID=767515 RepID=UPI00362002A2
MTGETRHLWMPVGELWNGGDECGTGNSTVLEGRSLSEVVDEYVDTAELRADNETRYQLRSISMAVARDITSNVLQDDLETDSTNKDRSEIPEIFTRLNMEGSDPKPYQLLLSKLMSYWPYAEEEDERINPGRSSKIGLTNLNRSSLSMSKKSTGSCSSGIQHT